jgi:hypothetical protein
MTEMDINVTDGFPKPWTEEIAQITTVIVTMGCGENRPGAAGGRDQEWLLPEPRRPTLAGRSGGPRRHRSPCRPTLGPTGHPHLRLTLNRGDWAIRVNRVERAARGSIAGNSIIG